MCIYKYIYIYIYTHTHTDGFHGLWYTTVAAVEFNMQNGNVQNALIFDMQTSVTSPRWNPKLLLNRYLEAKKPLRLLKTLQLLTPKPHTSQPLFAA